MGIAPDRAAALVDLDQALNSLEGPSEADLHLIESGADEEMELLMLLDLPHTITPPERHCSTEDWWPKAACRVGYYETDEAKRKMLNLMHPQRTDGPTEVAEAKAVCEGCPVREECLEYAVRARERRGIWGGLGGKERRPLMRADRMRRAQMQVLNGGRA